jgi:hypothetical protein
VTADRIDMRDAYGDECVLLAGEPLARHLASTMRPGIVACLSTPGTNHPVFTEDGAVEVASFLGRAVSPAACRDLLAELAPLACSDDLPEAVKAFLVGEAEAPHLKRITAEGLANGTVVRSLIELGRALGRAEAKDAAPAERKERECGMGGTCQWVEQDGDKFCDRCVMAWEDRFEDRVAYKETKARVANALGNSGYGRGSDAVRGAEDAVREWAKGEVPNGR